MSLQVPEARGESHRDTTAGGQGICLSEGPFLWTFSTPRASAPLTIIPAIFPNYRVCCATPQKPGVHSLSSRMLFRLCMTFKSRLGSDTHRRGSQDLYFHFSSGAYSKVSDPGREAPGMPGPKQTRTSATYIRGAGGV